MTYTTQELRAAKIKLLQGAKRQLKAEKEFFLCIALMAAAGTDNYLLMTACHELRMYIRSVLDGNITLDSWIREQPNMIYDTIDTKKARRDWADWMIKCLKEAK